MTKVWAWTCLSLQTCYQKEKSHMVKLASHNIKLNSSPHPPQSVTNMMINLCIGNLHHHLYPCLGNTNCLWHWTNLQNIGINPIEFKSTLTKTLAKIYYLTIIFVSCCRNYIFLWITWEWAFKLPSYVLKTKKLTFG